MNNDFIQEEMRRYDDIHSNFRVMLHSKLGFPDKGETAGSMAEKLKPVFIDFLKTSHTRLLKRLDGMKKDKDDPIGMENGRIGYNQAIDDIIKSHTPSCGLSDY